MTSDDYLLSLDRNIEHLEQFPPMIEVPGPSGMVTYQQSSEHRRLAKLSASATT